MLDYNFSVFLFEFLFFYIAYLLVVNNDRARNFVNKFKNFKLLILVVFLLQFLAILLIKFNVTDVFLFSDAGKNLLDGIDTYWIDADHGKYPFFPFLIFLHAGLVFLWQLLPALSFNFYLKVVLLLFLHFLGFLMYRQWKIKKDAKLKLLTFLLSPITYLIVLYHGQIDIILIVFLYLALRFFNNIVGWGFKTIKPDSYNVKLIISAILYAASIATKTWSVIMLPVFALPILRNFTLKEIAKFTAFLLIVVGLLLANIKIYTLLVFGSSVRTVLGALTHPGGPSGVWGLSLIFTSSKLLVVGLGLFWSYIYYQVQFMGKKFDIFLLSLMAILVFYIFTPMWGVQYIFWHWPFLLLFINMKELKNWIYQLVIPLYLFINYAAITTQGEFVPSWVTYGLGLIIYFAWLRLGIKFLKQGK